MPSLFGRVVWSAVILSLIFLAAGVVLFADGIGQDRLLFAADLKDPRQFQIGGRAPGGSRDEAWLWGRTARDVGNVQVRIPPGELKELRVGERIVVYPTGDPQEPYIAARWIAATWPWHERFGIGVSVETLIGVGLLLFVASAVFLRRPRLLRPLPGTVPLPEAPTLRAVDTAAAARLEEIERLSPNLYRVQLLCLILLGYAYLVVVLALLVVLTLAAVALLFTGKGAVIALKLLLPLALLLYAVARALWVKLEAPRGERVTRAEAPRLFALLDDLSEKLEAPRIHRVVVDRDFNAGVVRVPRLGIFGWPRNYLVIGLPLMQALSPEEFSAVLAHEVAHIGSKRGRLGAWVYRLRISWLRLDQALAARGGLGAWLFGAFFRWYAPYFHAYSFAFARRDEYFADRAGATLFGAPVAARALVNVRLKGLALDRGFWAEVTKEAQQREAPPDALHQRMGEWLATSWRTVLRPDDLDLALKVKTDVHDTHPSLADRLKAIGETPAIDGSDHRVSAAEALFGDSLPDLRRRLDADWSSGISDRWRELFRQAQGERTELAGFETKESLGPDESLRRAHLVERHRGAPAAVPLYEAILAERPEDPVPNYLLARIRLEEEGSETGLPLADKASTDLQLAGAAFDLKAAFFGRNGREDEALAMSQRAIEAHHRARLAEIERTHVRPDDVLEPHGLESEALEAILAILRAERRLGRAWLVRKKLTIRPEPPVFVLGVEKAAWRGSARPMVIDLAQALRVPQEIIVWPLEDENRWLKSCLKAAKSLIYRKS